MIKPILLTSTDIVAASAIISVQVKEYMYSESLKDMTYDERRKLFKSDNRWGIVAKLITTSTVCSIKGVTTTKHDEVVMFKGLTLSEAKQKIVSINNLLV